MAINLKVSENQERIPLRVVGGGLTRTVSPDDGSPYYVGARAYVTQTQDGATITVIDREGTTTANISNGADGEAGATGADGFSPIATVEKVDDTATITITDKYGTTTASISDGSSGGTGDYEDLENQPQINSVTLVGNLSSSDIGVADATHTHTASDITDFPTLATVATTGDYDDLLNKPTLFSGNYNDLTNKPTIPTVNNATLTIQKNGSTVKTFTANASSNVTANITVPTKVSDLTNDSGYITGYTETDPVFYASAAHGITSSDINNWNSKSDFSGSYNDLSDKPTIPTALSDLTNDMDVSDFPNDAGYLTSFTETDPIFTASAAHGITSSDITNWNSKQTALVSGTNIKTINNESILGSGNITVQGGGGGGTLVQIVRW